MWWTLIFACSAPAVPTHAVEPVPGKAASLRQVHLTIDDLPWQIERGQKMALSATEVARWNQRLIEALAQHEVQASAFFNCDRLQKGDGTVSAWVAAGHALGNHTASHLPAKSAGPKAFLENTAACQSTLTEAAAAPQWFRYPYLGYGADAASQAAIAQGLASLELRNLPVTAATSEWVYATAYRLALAEGDASKQAKIRVGYIDYMVEALVAGERIAESLEGRAVPQTVLIHANELNGHVLDELLDRYEAEGVRFVSASVAMADPVFAKPIVRVETWAVPWVVRVNPRASGPEEVVGWFSHAEGRAQEAWPLPPSPWPRGVAPVPESPQESALWGATTP